MLFFKAFYKQNVAQMTTRNKYRVTYRVFVYFDHYDFAFKLHICELLFSDWINFITTTTTFLLLLLNTVQAYGGEAIFLGDLNIKSVYWGSPIIESRGHFFTELLATLKMVIHNSDDKLIRCKRKSYIDVTYLLHLRHF